MNSDVLYIKRFRPLAVSDYTMSDATVRVLKTVMQMPSMRLLLVGEPACGKTSILNTIILEYYAGVPVREYTHNLMYITNLKDHGINAYKTSVKTFCQTCTTVRGKKKILILDNLDLLNEQSQQVFRTLIDKYSHAVQFIASCTNAQKVIEGIQSRLISVCVPPVKSSLLYSIIRKIKISDNLTVDEDAEEFVVNISNNCIKSVINSMELFKLLDRHITLKIAMESCTDINFFKFEEYIALIKSKQLAQAIQILYEIYNTGYSVIDILDNFFTFIKITHVISDGEKYNIVPVICKYITIFNNIHEDEIELPLFTNNIWQAAFCHEK